MITATAMSPLPDYKTNAFSGGAQDLTGETQKLAGVSDYSIFWKRNSVFWETRNYIASLQDLPYNWDSYGAVSPNAVAVRNAEQILSAIFYLHLEVSSIVPSAEGGVGFCFRLGDRYADIEATNEGEIIGVRYAGMEAPTLIEPEDDADSLQASLSEIKRYIEEAATSNAGRRAHQ